MNSGWIKLHRKLLDNPVFAKPSALQVWIALLLLANHEEDNSFVWNGSIVKQEPGQFITSRTKLARLTGLTETTIERTLEMLENGHQIGQQKTTKYRLITILKWKDYQDNGHQNGRNLDTKTDTIKKNTRSKEDKKKIREDIATNVADYPIVPLKDEESMKLEEFVASMRSSPQRYIRLIGEYADEIKPQFTTKAQWKVFTSRNLRAAKQLEPFTDEQIAKALTHIEKNKKSKFNPRGFISEWTIETLLKYITK